MLYKDYSNNCSCGGERAPSDDRGSTGQFWKRRQTAGLRAGGDGGAATKIAEGNL